MADGHADAVLAVVLGGDDVGRAEAVPVDHRVEDRLADVEVRIAVRPLALALRAGGDGVVALRPFDVLVAGDPRGRAARELRVALHEVAHEDRLAEALADQLVLGERARELAVVLVPVDDLERLLEPLAGALELVVVVELLVDAGVQARHVERAGAHAEGVEHHVAAQVRADDAHRDAADAEEVLAAEVADGGRAAREAQQARRDVVAERAVLVLEVGVVDAEDRTLLLVHRGGERLEPDGAGAVGLVEAVGALLPLGGADALAGAHELVGVAPGAGDPDVGADVLRGVVGLGAGAGARAVDDLGRDDDADGRAVGVADVLADEVVGLLGHAPGLFDVHVVGGRAAVGDGRDGDGGRAADEALVGVEERARGGGELGEIGTDVFHGWCGFRGC